jgi:hypothetical protein
MTFEALVAAVKKARAHGDVVTENRPSYFDQQYLARLRATMTRPQLVNDIRQWLTAAANPLPFVNELDSDTEDRLNAFVVLVEEQVGVPLIAWREVVELIPQAEAAHDPRLPALLKQRNRYEQKLRDFEPSPTPAMGVVLAFPSQDDWTAHDWNSWVDAVAHETDAEYSTRIAHGFPEYYHSTHYNIIKEQHTTGRCTHCRRTDRRTGLHHANPHTIQIRRWRKQRPKNLTSPLIARSLRCLTSCSLSWNSSKVFTLQPFPKSSSGSSRVGCTPIKPRLSNGRSNIKNIVLRDRLSDFHCREDLEPCHAREEGRGLWKQQKAA